MASAARPSCFDHCKGLHGPLTSAHMPRTYRMIHPRAHVPVLQADISGPGARIRALVIPTDEELSIAQQTLQVGDEGRVGRSAVVVVVGEWGFGPGVRRRRAAH